MPRYIFLRAGLLFGLWACFVPASMAQTGRVGINTINPLAVLHVADSSVVFTRSGSSTISNIQPPVTGAGSRMMWFPARVAFRVGGVSGLHWSRDSIGSASFATGFNSVASGITSFAAGYDCRATGFYTFAAGLSSQATDYNGVAMGNGARSTAISAVALGSGTLASSTYSTAFGYQTLASTQHSLATGSGTKTEGSYGSTAAAFNFESIARGASSASFGFRTIANPYASLALGRYNIDSGLDYTWYNPDPVFMIGNGTSDTTRANALTVLKNGNMGLFTSSPSFRLHVSNDNFNDGGYQEGIMVENTNTESPGEAAISFRNKSMPADRQWMIGINETPPHLSFAYGSSFTSPNTHMVIDTFGRIGINNNSPQSLLHVVRNLPSGGLYHASAIAIFESNNNGYIQLSSENTDETGFLSGNEVTSIRSAIVFAADSSIDLRAGGNGTDLKISTEGNVGIGIYTPAAKLHVNGTSKLGVNGTTITEIIKATVNANVGSVAANGGTVAQSFTVTNAALTSAVSVSQDGSLATGLVIASARVSAANTVEVRFVNTTAAAIDPPAMDYHFMVIR